MINEIQPDTKLPKVKAIQVYTALMTQTGTANPTTTVLQNTTGREWTWTRVGIGTYEIEMPVPEEIAVNKLATWLGSTYAGTNAVEYDGYFHIIRTANAAGDATDS